MLFTIYFVLYYHFTIYHFQSSFLPYTTFNLLFLVLLFTISDLLLFLPFTTFNSKLLHVPYTVFVLLYTTSSLHVLLFILLLCFIPFTILNLINYYIPSWFYYIPLPFYFLLLLHTLYSRNNKLNNKTNMKIINSTKYQKYQLKYERKFAQTKRVSYSTHLDVYEYEYLSSKFSLIFYGHIWYWVEIYNFHTG